MLDGISFNPALTGSGNTAAGVTALGKLTTGNLNTAEGMNALLSTSTGSSNTGIGNSALSANTTSVNNIALGNAAGSLLTTGNNNIDIGYNGADAESSTIRLGTKGTQTSTFIAGISAVTVARGVGVIVDSNGHLGTVTSSARFKENMQPMDKASEPIFSLQPVSFRYKKELDPEKIPQFGLVAEEVAKVDPDLVARDEDGKPYTVRYEAVNAMLLNEFLKEHRRVEEQQIALARQEAQIKALTAGLQRVSDKLEMTQPAPRTVSNKN